MINPVRPMTVVRPASAPKAAAPAPAAPAAAPVAKQQVMAPVQAKEWTLGRIFKAGGIGAAGFTAGTLGTAAADLLFHFGNNGGTSWPGGLYIAAAGLVAVGAMALYARASAK